MAKLKKFIVRLMVTKPEEKFLFSLWGVLILLRLPSIFEPYWYGDEAIYLTIGQGLKKGLILYKDIYDNKTPLIYWLAELGNNVAGFRLILLAWMIFSTYNFYYLIKKITKNNHLANILAILFVIITSIPMLEGNIANSEIFIIGFSVWAANIVADKEIGKKYFFGGIIAGLGFLTKVVALFDFGAITLWLMAKIAKNNRGKIKKIMNNEFKVAYFIGGFFLVIAAVMIYFWRQNAMPEFIKAAFLQNFGYVSSWSGKASVSFWKSNILKRAILAGLISLLAVGLYLKNVIKNDFFLLGLIWIFLGLFAVTLSERPYPHYLIQLIPGSLILAGGLFEEIKQNKQAKIIPLSLVGLTLVGIFLTVKKFNFYFYPSVSYYKNFISWSMKQKSTDDYYRYFDERVPNTYKVANLVNETTSGNDQIFIWGDEPYIYALTRRLPPEKYVVSYHIVELNQYNFVFQSLVKNPPELIIYFKSKKPNFKKLNRLIKKKYFLLSDNQYVLIWKKL